MRKLEYKIDCDIVIKDYIKKNIGKKFYRYLKRVGYELYLNNDLVKEYYKAFTDDILTIKYNEDTILDTNYYQKELDIIYEEKDFMVLYKPKGLKTIPTGYNDFKSLYNMILYYYKENNINGTIHFINRLDKDTEGLLLVAKNKITANIFSKSLNNINREYLALVEGIVTNSGTISIGIKKEDGIKRVPSLDGKPSLTYFEVVKNYGDKTLLKLRLDTGRCHQIRVHMSYINHPIVGDPLYGSGDDLHLCSFHIKFINPTNNMPLEFVRYPRWYDYNEEQKSNN
ncbi:MAG: RluA family pseudouridine synthase [Anaeroplasmataceae bacterium]